MPYFLRKYNNIQCGPAFKLYLLSNNNTIINSIFNDRLLSVTQNQHANYRFFAQIISSYHVSLRNILEL